MYRICGLAKETSAASLHDFWQARSSTWTTLTSMETRPFQRSTSLPWPLASMRRQRSVIRATDRPTDQRSSDSKKNCDIWSAGMFAHELSASTLHPFVSTESDSSSVVYRRAVLRRAVDPRAHRRGLRLATASTRDRLWNRRARSFLKSVLRMDPSKQPAASVALDHDVLLRSGASPLEQVEMREAIQPLLSDASVLTQFCVQILDGACSLESAFHVHPNGSAASQLNSSVQLKVFRKGSRSEDPFEERVASEAPSGVDICLELRLEFETQGDRGLRSEAATESSCLLQDGPAAESPTGPQTGGIVSVKAENDAATNQAHNARCHEPCKGQGGGHLTFGCWCPHPARHVSIGCCDLDSVTCAAFFYLSYFS